MVDNTNIFPQTYSGAPPPVTEGEPPLILSSAEAIPPTDMRYQRTMIGLGGAFALMMSATDRMPDALARVTKLPRSSIDQIRCGAAQATTMQDLCTLAEALGCELEVRLNQRRPPTQ